MTGARRLSGLAAMVALLVAGCGPAASSGVPAPAATISPARQAPSTGPGPARHSKQPRGKVLSLTAGPVDGSAYTIEQDGPLLVAGTEGTGVLVSGDGGAHWRAMNAGLPPNPAAIAIAIEPGSGRIMALVSGAAYAATPHLPLRWQPWGGALPRGTNPQAIAYWPPAHGILVGDGSGALYASRDQNGPWREADSGLPVNRAAISFLRPVDGRLYAGLTAGLATSDDGTRWRMIPGLAGHSVTDLEALPRGGLAAALDRDGIAVRVSGAAPWTIYSTGALGLTAGERVLSLAYDPNTDHLFMGTLGAGVRALHGLAPPTSAVQGVPPGDPVNRLLPAGESLLAATNSGIIAVSRAAPGAHGG